MTTNNQHLPEDILDDALAMVAAGIPVDVVLAEAGSDAEWLEPLLTVASQAASLKTTITVPPPAASLNKMLAHAEKMAAAAAPVSPPATNRGLLSWLRPGPLFATGLRTATLTVSVLIAFLAGTIAGSGMTMAAQNSVPGQPFYGLKRMGESVRLSLLDSNQHRQRLEDTFNLERRFETDLLLDRGKEVVVIFEDSVQSLGPDSFVIDEGVVKLTADSQIFGDLAPGARVRIQAITQPPDSLRALSVWVVRAAPPTPTPTVTPSPTVKPTQPATATPSATPTMATSSDTLALPPTPTPVPTEENLAADDAITPANGSTGGTPTNSNDGLTNSNDDGLDNNADFNDNGDDFSNSGSGSSNNDDDFDDSDFNDNGSDDEFNDNTSGGHSDDNSNDNIDVGRGGGDDNHSGNSGNSGRGSDDNNSGSGSHNDNSDDDHPDDH